MERRRRNLSKAAIFGACAPLGLEKIGREIDSRVCITLRGIRYIDGSTSVYEWPERSLYVVEICATGTCFSCGSNTTYMKYVLSARPRGAPGVAYIVGCNGRT